MNHKDFSEGHWSFLGLGEEDKWYGTCACKLERHWDEDANLMIGHFKESGQPVFRGIRAFNRGILKERWKTHDSLLW